MVGLRRLLERLEAGQLRAELPHVGLGAGAGRGGGILLGAGRGLGIEPGNGQAGLFELRRKFGGLPARSLLVGLERAVLLGEARGLGAHLRNLGLVGGGAGRPAALGSGQARILGFELGHAVARSLQLNLVIRRLGSRGRRGRLGGGRSLQLLLEPLIVRSESGARGLGVVRGLLRGGEARAFGFVSVGAVTRLLELRPQIGNLRGGRLRRGLRGGGGLGLLLELRSLLLQALVGVGELGLRGPLPGELVLERLDPGG